MKRTKHTQCLLERNSEKQVSWIPAEFAKKGNFVKLKNRGSNQWSDGWEVKETYNTLFSDQLERMNSLNKGHRKATDI